MENDLSNKVLCVILIMFLFVFLVLNKHNVDMEASLNF